MGTYCTTTSLQTLMYGVNFDTATTSLATECIDMAENEINKYMSKRYDTSSFYTNVPPLVCSWCKSWSAGKMWVFMSRGGKDSIVRGRSLIKGVRENMEDVREYKMHLVDTAGSILPEKPNTAWSIKCSTSDYTPTFNEDAPENWKVDSDKLQDIADERD